MILEKIQVSLRGFYILAAVMPKEKVANSVIRPNGLRNNDGGIGSARTDDPGKKGVGNMVGQMVQNAGEQNKVESIGWKRHVIRTSTGKMIVGIKAFGPQHVVITNINSKNLIGILAKQMM